MLSSKLMSRDYIFHGLASYYNTIHYYIVENNKVRRINEGEVIELNLAQWLAATTRFNVLLIKSSGLIVELNKSDLLFSNPEVMDNSLSIAKFVTKSKLSDISPELDQLRYTHLWQPLAALAKLVESALIMIQTHMASNWGLTIVIFSILLKFLLLPIDIMTACFQRRVNQVKAQLTPELVKIKAEHDGEVAHNRLMKIHKDLGVSPFYTLKPMLGALIQIPILIAVFNALAEMPQLNGQSFLWIKNLAYPDSVGHFSFTIPMLGDTISLLPFIMTVATLYSTIIFQNLHAAEVELKRQKRNLYLMAAAFFVLFYPFPAAMVLYWTLANIFQAVQQHIIKIQNEK